MIYFNRSFFRIFDSFLIPPLMGFFAKQFVLYSAIQSGYYFMSIVGIIVSVISASYYLKIIKLLHIPNNNIKEDATAIDVKVDSYLSQFHSFIISCLTLFIILFIFKPTLILSSTQVLSLTLFTV